MKRLICLLCCVMVLAGCRAGQEEKSPTPTEEPPTELEAVEQTQESEQTEAPEETAAPTEPTAQERIEALLAGMTVEEKVGQMFLARCPESGAAEAAVTFHLGGFVLFGRDFENETPESCRQKLAELQSAVAIPLLLAVDEEGGTVTRVSSHSAFRDSRFPSPRSLYEQGGLELVLQTEREKCRLLRSLGIQVNLAPVCDVTTEPGAFMYDRSLGQDAETTAEYVAAVVTVMKEEQIGAVLKHFPGYGDNADTHMGIAVDDRPYSTFVSGDFLPFASGIEVGCGAILVSHNTVTCMDGELPASLSPEVHRILREELGFDGVIVTDDLSMEAITDVYGAEEAAVQAVLAGNDLLCCTDFETQYQAVLDAVSDGRIPLSVIDEAAARVLRWKLDLGLLQEDLPRMP